MHKKLLYFFFLLFNLTTYSQHARQPSADSLAGKSFTYLIDKIDDHEISPPLQQIYGRAFLRKAKKEHNPAQTVAAYKMLLHLSPRSLKLQYADSMIVVASRAHDDALTGSAYLTKGVVYYDLKHLDKALQQYLMANTYIARTDDQYLNHKTLFNIAVIKHYLGFENEAVGLLKKCASYFENVEPKAYLSSLHSLGLCYIRLHQYRLCTTTNDLGIKAAQSFGHEEMVPYFNRSEGVNQYFQGNDDEAIRLLQSALPFLSKDHDFANAAAANFYIGKSLQRKGQSTEALQYFKAVDAIYLSEHYINPELRENYEILIRYYEVAGDLKNELVYTKRLIAIDAVLQRDYQYLSSKIHKDFDTAKLILNQKRIEKSLVFRDYIDYFFVAVIILLTVIVAMYVRKKHVFKKRFDDLMTKATTMPEVKKNIYNPEIEIKPEIVDAVLKKLDIFIEKKKYLETEITLQKLADHCNSNQKYVSKIIATYYQKKSTDFTNDLKIEYVLELLLSEKKYCHYTFKALSEEGGFITTQHFTRAFFKKTGINPEFFLESLRKKYS